MSNITFICVDFTHEINRSIWWNPFFYQLYFNVAARKYKKCNIKCRLHLCHITGTTVINFMRVALDSFGVFDGALVRDELGEPEFDVRLCNRPESPIKTAIVGTREWR